MGRTQQSDAVETHNKGHEADGHEPVHTHIMADGTVVIVGLGGAIVISTDGGKTFVARNRPDRKNLCDVAAGANGGIVIFGEVGIVHEDVKPVS